MMRMQAAVFFVFVFTLAACGKAPEGSPEEGKKWFAMYRCSGCHGAQGDGGKGPKLRGAGLSFGQFEAKVRKSKSTIMPSYDKDKVSDQDLADMYAFLQG
jgi:mono/diheme cytochrome c family protein